MGPELLIEGALHIVEKLRSDPTDDTQHQLDHLKWLLEQTQRLIQPQQQKMF